MFVLEKQDGYDTELVCGGSLKNVRDYTDRLILNTGRPYKNHNWDENNGIAVREYTSEYPVYIIRHVPMLRLRPTIV